MLTEKYATFEKGDTVRATQNTHNLTGGDIYTIFKVIRRDANIYERVYYVTDKDGYLLKVGNGHINFELI